MNNSRNDFGWCRLILYVVSAVLAFWIANKISPIRAGLMDALIALLIFLALLFFFWWVSRRICGLLGGTTYHPIETGAAAGSAALGAGAAVARDAVEPAAASASPSASSVTIDAEPVEAEPAPKPVAKPAAKKPAPKPAAKPAKKPAAKKPAAKKAAAKPAAKVASKPAAKKPAAKKPAAKPAAKATSAKSMTATERKAAEASAGLLKKPRGGKADDLKRIKGIGPKLETLCNKLGVWHFDQIAAWKAADIKFVDENLEGFNGRIKRDGWVKQAKTLAKGGETEFSKRVDKGSVY